MTKVRPATWKDVEYFAVNMRKEDWEECLAITGMTGRDALAVSYRKSQEAYAVEVEGRLVSIFGVVPPGCLWMMFTNDVERLPMSFFRESRKRVQVMVNTYEYIGNYTAPANTFILKWLTWLGFSIGPVELFNHVPVRRFHIERIDSNCV
ncbi:MAG: epsilon15p13 [Firmicutes bacterium]|nr:epsilon15p13 [Bacillota bacterium]